jgi:17beta-estradiol 17-dehydrogenase / very-long-chain 3-oxoacyl-CoA reductase
MSDWSETPTVVWIFAILGTLWVVKVFIWEFVCGWLWLYVFRPASDWSVYGDTNSQDRSNRSWALVTGGTEGVGQGFAQELASRGYNIILTARRQERLDQVCNELSEEFDCNTRNIVCDASDTSEDNIQKVVDAVQDIDLAVLVNNVGFNTAIPESLEQMGVSNAARMIVVNCVFPSMLTTALIPQLASRERSAVVNVSSIASYLPGALMVPYAASKAFNRMFSTSLSAELEPQGIDVLCVTPGYVLSASNPIKEESLMVITARHHAKCALDKMNARMCLFAYWGHS